MKTNFTHIVIIRIILFILICLYSILVFGQDVNPKTASMLVVNGVKTALATELSGTVANEKVNLQWSFDAVNDVSTVVIEKGYTTTEFKDCAIFWVNVDGNNFSNFKYADKLAGKRDVYYRLKIVENNGKIYYSNTFHVAGKTKK